MIFVDTGAWYASLVPSDPDHARAVRWLAENHSPLLTTDYVIDETLTLLRVRGERKRALLLGMRFFRHDLAEIHKITSSDLALAWKTFEQFDDKDWSSPTARAKSSWSNSVSKWRSPLITTSINLEQSKFFLKPVKFNQAVLRGKVTTMKTNAIRIMLVLASIAIVVSLTSAGTFAGLQKSGSTLSGTAWQLVKFQGPDEKTFAPDDKSKYTITFDSNGRVTVRVDCNRGSSTWKVAANGELQFGSWSRTNAKCGAGSLHDQIVTEGADVHNFDLKDGHLFLFGMPRGGYYELEPLPGQKK